ncbi:hypothetical protein QBC35DRAFT_495279 [Podospora australis]|uniref:Uncharacterized protein n=1 Tax=Podospora australis TaxID=1536484 RepID=A0AAN6WWA4_9PEZI|nr:hypothetical protein QBC35DRAFT_495279 [Podospora australis]
MHTLRTSAAALLFALGVTAQFNPVAEAAHQNPNATRSVKFKPFPGYDNWDSTEWTWRVNVTDYAQRNSSLHLRTIDTTYDFSWSGGQNLSQAFPINNRSFCFSYYIAGSTPANITNLYTDDNKDSTDCTPVLGEACVNAILDSTPANSGNSNTSCSTPRTIWSDIPECYPVFGYMRTQSPRKSFAVSTSSIKNLPPGGVVGALSSGSNQGNATIYDEQLNSLHVALLNPAPLVEDGRTLQLKQGTRTSKQLICMRVSTERREVTQDDGDDDNNEAGENNQGGGDDDHGENAAGRTAAVGWLAGLMVAFGVVFAL